MRTVQAPTWPTSPQLLPLIPQDSNACLGLLWETETAGEPTVRTIFDRYLLLLKALIGCWNTLCWRPPRRRPTRTHQNPLP